jgi:cell wall-associated NlpC family hydrolase
VLLLVLVTVLAVVAAPHAAALRGRLTAAGLHALHLPHLPLPASPSPAGSGRAGRVVAYALGQRGKPYQWGAQGPGAFDCSGLTWAAYRSAGLDWPRLSADGQWQRGPRVHGHPQPGDLVFFHTSLVAPGRAGHVGVYLGSGRMVAAPHPGSPVRIGLVDRAGYLGATRPQGGGR